MKKIILFAATIFMCAGLFAKVPNISEGKITNSNYIYKKNLKRL